MPGRKCSGGECQAGNRARRAAETWPVNRADLVLSINMIHIAPWAAAIGLMRGAACTSRYRVLFLYGPFRRGGRHTASSNEAFDRNLGPQDPAWGVRDLEAVTALAAAADLLRRS
jgi:hypothetical protein